MYKKDGSPDLRYSSNRRGTSGSLSSFDLSFLNGLEEEKNKKAYLLRDYRSELLKVEPNLIKTLLKLVTEYGWCTNNISVWDYDWVDRGWLAKKTPEVKTYNSSGENLGEDDKDSFEKQIENLDHSNSLLEEYSDVETLLQGYLNNDLEPNSYDENTVKFDKNINIIERIMSNALLVEKKILRREEEFLARQKEKEEKSLVKWISEYGYCTRNRKYESSFESFFPLTKDELHKAKRKLIEENKLYDMYQGIDWLEGIDYDAKQIIRLIHLTEKEILYVKENFVLLEDPNVCDLEIQRRSELKFWKKLYELIFIRISLELIDLVKHLLSGLIFLSKFILTKIAKIAKKKQVNIV